MPSVSIYFSTDDEEAYHQALALVGDKKAIAINNLRRWEGFYDVKLQTVVDYVLNYIDQCQKLGSKVAYEKHCNRISGINTSTLQKGFWKNIVPLIDNPPTDESFKFIQPTLVPFMRQQFGGIDD